MAGVRTLWQKDGVISGPSWQGVRASDPLAWADVVGRDGIEPPVFSRLRRIQIRPARFACVAFGLVHRDSRRLSTVPLATRPRPGFSTEAVQTPVRVNVTWVTPLGEEVASTW